MIGFCPHCEKATNLTKTTLVEEFEIRGEIIQVEVTLFKCEEESHEFEDPLSENDPIENAYREYRRRFNMLQPEEIKELRLSFGLIQRELTNLLGWGGATLSRYENGALQSEAHDRILKLAMEPRNLLSLVKDQKSDLPEETAARLIENLQEMVGKKQLNLKAVFEEHYGYYVADDYSGFKELDLDKLLNAILFFSVGNGVFKTKLNKLLFYSDFKHYKDYSVSITGARYAHLPYGPTPDHYALLLAILQEEDRLVLMEEAFAEYVGEIVIAKDILDISVFSTSELKILSEVKEYFEGYNSRQISELSHNETGYKETHVGNLISYQFSDFIQL